MCKKLFILTLTAALLMHGFTAYAQTVSVVVDGKPVELSDAPREINGRLFLPMRALFETLGAEVSWDAETQTAVGRLGDRAAEFTAGYNVYVKYYTPDNYIYLMLDEAPRVINGKLYLTVREAGEGLGYRVRWDGAARTVYLDRMSPGEDKLSFTVYVETDNNVLEEELTEYIRSLPTDDQQIDELMELDYQGYKVKYVDRLVYRNIPEVVEEEFVRAPVPDDSIFDRQDIDKRMTTVYFDVDRENQRFLFKKGPGNVKDFSGYVLSEALIPNFNRKVYNMAKELFMENHTVEVCYNEDPRSPRVFVSLSDKYLSRYAIYSMTHFRFILYEQKYFNAKSNADAGGMHDWAQDFSTESYASLSLNSLKRYNGNGFNKEYYDPYPPYIDRLEKAVAALVEDEKIGKEITKYMVDIYIKHNIKKTIPIQTHLTRVFGSVQVDYSSGYRYGTVEEHNNKFYFSNRAEN